MRRIAFWIALLLAVAVALPDFAPSARAEYDMPYYIEVDISSQVVTVYETATHDVIRQMICSTGMNDCTPTGEYMMPESAQRYDRQPWYYIKMFRRYVKYATRIYGEILFHSLPYTRKSMQSIDAQAASELGYPTSHGCIRLRWQDAEFIARNCLPGTGVRIFKSGVRDEGLRELLYEGAYDASSGLPYDSFLGFSSEEGALGRSSKGGEVLDLQYRLRDLGLYDGELNGVYGGATVNAVRVAQYLLGEDLNGVADAAFLEKIFSGEAPTATNVSLKHGSSGPAVRSLQSGLAALLLYEGALNGVFDAALEDAMGRFCQAYGYAWKGVAEPRMQKAVDFEARRLRENSGGKDAELQWSAETLMLARVSAGSGLEIREKPSGQGKALKRLNTDARMVVVRRGRDWSLVRADGVEGYVNNARVEFLSADIATLNYVLADGPTYTVGHTAADYSAGARLPSEVFEEYLAANDQWPDVSRLAYYATVDTRGEAEALNLRQTPDPAGVILGTVENGTSLRVRRRGEEWTRVSVQGRQGYLMNAYLNFRTGLDNAMGEEEPEAAEPRAAIVKSATFETARVYESNSEYARVLGHLDDGAPVEMLEYAEGWCRIRYQQHEGYMLVEDLQPEE